MLHVDAVEMIIKDRPLISRVYVRNTTNGSSSNKCLSAPTFNQLISQLPQTQAEELNNCVLEVYNRNKGKLSPQQLNLFDVLTPRKLPGNIHHKAHCIRITDSLNISTNLYGGKSEVLVDNKQVYDFMRYREYLYYSGVIIPKLNLLVTENESNNALCIKQIADIDTASYYIIYDKERNAPIMLALYHDSWYMVTGVIADSYKGSYIIPIRFTSDSIVEVVLWERTGDKLSSFGPATGKSRVKDLLLPLKEELAFPILNTHYNKELDLAKSYDTDLTVSKYFNLVAYHNAICNTTKRCGIHLLNGYLDFDSIVSNPNLMTRLINKAEGKTKSKSSTAKTNKKTPKKTSRKPKSKAK